MTNKKLTKNANKNLTKNAKQIKKENCVYVKGQKYKIELINENEFYLGKCSYDNHKIYITKNLSQKAFFEVLCHELLHVYFHECGLPTYKNDEILIEYISSIYLDLNDNFKKVFFEILKNYNFN